MLHCMPSSGFLDMGLCAISRSIVAQVPLTETIIFGAVLAGIKGILYVLQDHSKSAEKLSVFHGKLPGKRPLMS